MRKLNFTPKAEQRLEEISDWTFERFGPRQAEIYEQELFDRCLAVANGEAATQNCSVLTKREVSTPLRFGRAGQHIVVFLDYPERCVIVEILHSSSDLAQRIEQLAQLLI